MTTIPGFQIGDRIFTPNAKTVIYRGFREFDRVPVILKTIAAEYPTIEDITRLKHEYEILKNLDIGGIVKPLGLENYQNGLLLILEDIGGESLGNFRFDRSQDLATFLAIAIQLADSIGKLHHHNIIHKDIKPSNIIFNASTKEVQLIDFSIATRLDRENPTLSHPTLLEGTLAYMSPEQTGRMNRAIDYRTDFYSLGVTFYEILTGTVPFNATDPLELVHCHIAKNPTPIQQVNPEIPPAIAAIIMKLIAKTAEERYQSGWGLKTDLETCLTQLQTIGKIENFTPGHWDKSGQFLISQKLYGREREVSSLMDAFDRINTPNGSEMLLVSGYSGIGKTSVVNEVHKPIVRQQGYFIAGKFDQFKRNIPYDSIIQAFQELIQQLLTESSERIVIWKEKIFQAIGTNGKAIVDVIPEVESILGSQPELPQLGPSEAQNRFNRVFKQFIHVFTQPEHPLVIFLDDLQWADAASLKLIQLLITDPQSQYLLLIGAYRDNEVSPTHPLMVTLEEIKKTGAKVTDITLRALDLENVDRLVADTLQVDLETAKPLAELVFNKTQGNPFFLTQLLKTLYQEKLLIFNFDRGEWQWDIEQILSIGIIDYNVVELIARNIQKLSASTQAALKLAACIGDKFNLEVLAIVNQKSEAQTAGDLWQALQAGLILPLSDAYKVPLLFDGSIAFANQIGELKVRYKFLHDRVQQAAYSLIAEAERKETHLSIGQLLLDSTSPEDIEDNIFEIVNQLNVGADFITHQPEKDRLASLNLIAGKKAKAAAAYEAYLKYVTLGLDLLGSDSWESQYEMTLNLHIEKVEAEYLNINFAAALHYAEIVLSQAKNLLDRVRVYELKIPIYATQMQTQLAIDTGLEVLEMLGVTLIKEPPKDLIIEQLGSLPRMSDPDRLAVMRVLSSMIPTTYSVAPILLSHIVFTMVNFAAKYGNSPQAAYAYTLYGVILCGAIGDIETGYKFGKLSLHLLEVFDTKEFQTKIICMFDSCIRHWKEPARETLETFLLGIQSGFENGDIEHAGYCASQYGYHTFLTGQNLELVIKRLTQYIEVLESLKQVIVFNLKLAKQLALNLAGNCPDRLNLRGEAFNETEIVPILLENNVNLVLFFVYVAKAMLCYIFKEPELAIENAITAEKYAGNAAGLFILSEYNFYYSVALIAVYPTLDSTKQSECLDRVAKNQEKMKFWADLAPFNFQHKYDLVEAEKARVLGEVGRAMEYYDRAIQQAKEQGYTHHEAIANELAAEFYFDRGREKIAQIYLTEAYYGYIRWEAKAKVKDLEARYPEFFSKILTRETPNLDATRTTNATTSGNLLALDFATAIKASQAISSEIVLETLLEKLMQIAIENAGAQKGVLLLNQQDKLAVVAEKNVEEKRVVLLPYLSLEDFSELPIGIINYVERTKNNVILNDAMHEGIFTNDVYITDRQVKSILCSPIINQGKLIGIIYLENNLTKSAFTPERIEILRMLSSQAAISIELARNVKKVEDNLAYLDAIVNNIADGLLVTDVSDRVARINPAFLTMFNLESEKIIGQKCQDISPKLAEIVSRSKLSKKEILTVEVEMANSRIGKAVATAISTNDECLGTVTIIRDITAEKEIDRMKTDFISTVSHELRTPLTSVIGFAKLIQKKLEEGIFPLIQVEDRKTERNIRQVGENINIIISEGERLTSLINDVLDIAKMEAGKVEWQIQPSSIEEIIDRAIASTSALVEAKGLTLHKEVASGLPEVMGDRDRLLQVTINIISNAVKFTDKGSITCRAMQLQDEILISIIDTGIGIDPDDREKVFEKFKQVGDTLTDKPKGTGLGLPICKQIIEHHGGRIWVESQVENGSNFSFTIPISKPNYNNLKKINIDILVRQLTTSSSQTDRSPTNQPKSILVVDDDPHIRQLLRQQLEAQNYRVREAIDGIDAINQVKKEKPDLIILDVMMPQINGFDVAAVLKNNLQTSDIPIIILSIVEDKQKGYCLGSDRYLKKPIDLEELLEDIDVLLSQGLSKKKVLVVDEDASTMTTLSEVLQAKQYTVVEASNDPEWIDRALSLKPDPIVVDSVFSEQHNLIQTWRFAKGLENVVFVLLASSQQDNQEKA